MMGIRDWEEAFRFFRSREQRSAVREGNHFVAFAVHH
jgi:hypothetical protein